MDTFFADPKRTDEKTLAEEISFVSENPLMTCLLLSLGGLLAVLNEQRQVVSLNDSFFKMLNLDNPLEILGLRVGEVLHCIHAQEEPAGCGTTQFCSSCGAVIAMVLSLIKNESVERNCVMTAIQKGALTDLVFHVRATPLLIQSRRFVLFFLQDITAGQQRAVLERTFFHDIRNMLAGIVGVSELLTSDPLNQTYPEVIHTLSKRLLKETEIQQYLLKADFSYLPELSETTSGKVMEELKAFFTNHPLVQRKHLLFADPLPGTVIKTDLSLLLRVLCNMVTNALEASDPEDAIKVWTEKREARITFFVWNRQAIDDQVALRIFQRNFSTKKESGRGIGTYAMKLFGEKMLGGAVSFSTSEKEGTLFSIGLPL